MEAAVADAQSPGALCEGSAAASENLEVLAAAQESCECETSLRMQGGATAAGTIHYDCVLDSFLDAQRSVVVTGVTKPKFGVFRCF